MSYLFKPKQTSFDCSNQWHHIVHWLELLVHGALLNVQISHTFGLSGFPLTTLNQCFRNLFLQAPQHYKFLNSSQSKWEQRLQDLKWIGQIRQTSKICIYGLPPGTGFVYTALNQRSSTLLLETHYPTKFISSLLQHTSL